MKTLGIRMALREKRRHTTTILGVATAIVLTVFMVGVYRGALHGSLDYVVGADAHVWVGRIGTWNLMRTSGLLDPEAGVRAAGVAGVEAVTPILVALLPADGDGTPRTLLVIGIDDSGAAPRSVRSGVSLPHPGEIVVDAAFADRFGVNIGETMTLANHPLTVVGISRNTNLLVTQYAFVSRQELGTALGLPGRATFLLCRGREGEDPVELARRIEAALPGTSAFTHTAFVANNRLEIEQGFLPVLSAMTVLGTLASLAIVALATAGGVRERRMDYAVLIALGLRRSECARVVVQQATAAAMAGGVIALGVLLVLERLLPLVVPEVEFRLEPALAGIALLAAVVTGAGGALASAHEAGSVPPMEVFRG